jgi:hypothetical protein
VWASAVIMPPVLWALRGFHVDAIRGMLIVMAIGLGISALFFVAALGTAIGYDINRNWGRSERAVEWNPLWFWKVFLHAGACMFLLFAFFAYRQGWWLPVEFGALAVLCHIAARGLNARVRLPERAVRPKQGDAALSSHSRPKHWGGGHLHAGFVAMEYYAVVLNRSFLVFITEDGLRGWRFHGFVSSMEPLFYKPAEDLLNDPELSPGSPAFDELMQHRHTFFVPYAKIISVELIEKQKWGMGPIPHAGRLKLHLLGFPSTREFILLGQPHAHLIRDMLLSRVGPRL